MALRVNGESFQVADSQLQRAAFNWIFEVDGRTAAELRLTELDQAAPENGQGYYRLRAEGDVLLIQRAASTAIRGNTWRDWVDATTLMELSGTGIVFKVPIDLSSLAGFTGTIIDTVPVDFPSVVWLGEGHGPSELPVGYLAVMVNSDEEVGYIPFWRGQQ